MDEKLDKTKANININNLNDSEKKELYKKFVDAGGEAVNEKKRSKLVIDRDKQKEYQRNLDNHRRKVAKPVQRQTARIAKPRPAAVKAGPSYFDIFRIRLKLKFLKIATFDRFYFNRKFFDQFSASYKPSFMELQILYLNLFKKDPAEGKGIIKRLDSARALYFELIEMIGGIFDKMAFDQITANYQNFPEAPEKVSDLKGPLIDLFRKLYVLKPYENMILTAFERSLEIHRKISQTGGSFPYSSTRKNLKKWLFVIFHRLYPRLHWLFCHYQNMVYDTYDQEIEKALNIQESDKPGSRMIRKTGNQVTPGQVSDVENLPDQKEDEKPAEKETPEQKAVKQGLKFMYNVDFREMKRDLDKMGMFRAAGDSDKVFMTYLLFNEFDREYAFVLSTTRIKFNIETGSRGENSMKLRLVSLYDEMKKPVDKLREYADCLTDYEKIRAQRPERNDRYILFVKKLEMLEKKKNQIGKEARSGVYNFMKNVADIMKRLSDDMESGQVHIANPQDIIEFEFEIEGNKKLHGKKIYEAVFNVYCFAMAFLSRLEPGGDLSGTGEMDGGDPITMGSGVLEEPVKEGLDPLIEEQPDKSILDELDDMI